MRFPSRAQRQFYRQSAETLAKVAWSRSRHGPKEPGWSLRYEVLVEMLRVQFGGSSRELTPTELARVRKRFDAIGEVEDKRDRSVTEWTRVAGLKAAWLRPKYRTPEEGVVLYLHGGGYMVGSPTSHRGIMGSIAVHTRRAVLGIDYRLAPENPCPAGIEDALEAYRWLLERYDASQIVIAGDSAGGGLTAATLVAVRDAGLPLPAGAVLISAWLDLSATPRNGGSDYIFIDDHIAAKRYAGERSLGDPQVSPLYADLSGLPPLLVIAGGVETLVDQSIEFARRAQAAGVRAQLHVEPHEIHVYPAFFEMSARAQNGLGRIAQFITAQILQPHSSI